MFNRILSLKRILLLVFISVSLIGQAQVDCATKMDDCFPYIVDDTVYGRIDLPPSSRLHHYTLCIHTIFSGKETPGILDAEINNAFESLKVNFKETGFVFDTLLFNIEDSNYNVLDIDSDLMNDLSRLYDIKNRINIYLVETINGAKSYIPNVDPAVNENDIFITKDAIKNSELLSHSMGHIFGLAHINETTMGIEKPDRSNCSTTGDKVCDTFLDHSWNIMNETIAASCRFSNGQIRKMMDFASKHKSYLQ